MPRRCGAASRWTAPRAWFAPRGTGNAGRHQRRVLPATRAGARPTSVPQILDALARALQLDFKATQYLHTLVAPPGGVTSELEADAYALAEVIELFSMPAVLVNRYRDVLAANPIAQALSPEFIPGQNTLRWRILDPAARELYADWDEATEIAVSGLRELSGFCLNDARMQELVAELSSLSARFRELWTRAVVGYRFGIQHMRHPLVGELYLHRNRLNAPYPGGDHVLMYRAEPGSPSAMALEELRSLSMRELDRLGLS